jgi:GNAT superfamily N-acetyltransferase
MPNTQYTQLAEPLWPLLNKFYRSHQSSMKAVRDAQLWVGKRDEIIAGLCLRPMAEGFWLTGLFVDPALRGQGIAGALMAQALVQIKAPVWLFCHPDLREFYERNGFTADPLLPYALAERLARYKRNKPMIAMGFQTVGASLLAMRA